MLCAGEPSTCCCLCSEDFDVAEFTSRALAGSHTTASAQTEQLQSAIRELDGEISTEVQFRNRELLATVRKMLDAENSLQDVVLSVESLRSEIVRDRQRSWAPMT